MAWRERVRSRRSDYNPWMAEKMPVILILFDAVRKRAYWLAVKDYFRDNTARRPQKGAKTVRVRIAMGLTLDRRAIARMRAMRNELGAGKGDGRKRGRSLFTSALVWNLPRPHFRLASDRSDRTSLHEHRRKR